MKTFIPSILLIFIMIMNGCSDANTSDTTTNDNPKTSTNEISDTSSSTDDLPTETEKESTIPSPVVQTTTASTPAQTPTVPATPTPIVTSYTIPVINEATKQAYLEAINVARGNIQSCGAYGDYDATNSVTWNNALYKAAYEHSYDLANSNTFSHTGSNTQYDITAQQQSLNQGSSFSQRMENNGYINWTTIGENISAGYSTVQAVVDGWLASDGHCANMMNPNFTEVGLALVYKADTQYKYYWTQNFGAR